MPAKRPKPRLDAPAEATLDPTQRALRDAIASGDGDAIRIPSLKVTRPTSAIFCGVWLLSTKISSPVYVSPSGWSPMVRNAPAEANLRMRKLTRRPMRSSEVI